jgi:hypothetical protein
LLALHGSDGELAVGYLTGEDDQISLVQLHHLLARDRLGTALTRAKGNGLKPISLPWRHIHKTD